MLPRKMSGSIKHVELSDMNKQLQSISDIIDSYDITMKLLEEENKKHKKTSKSFIITTVQGETVESILGKNYKFNYYKKTKQVSFHYSNKIKGFESTSKVEEYIKGLDDSFTTFCEVSPIGYSNFNVVIEVGFGKEVKPEKILNIINTLAVE